MSDVVQVGSAPEILEQFFGSRSFVSSEHRVWSTLKYRATLEPLLQRFSKCAHWDAGFSPVYILGHFWWLSDWCYLISRYVKDLSFIAINITLNSNLCTVLFLFDSMGRIMFKLIVDWKWIVKNAGVGQPAQPFFTIHIQSTIYIRLTIDLYMIWSKTFLRLLHAFWLLGPYNLPSILLLW